MSGCDDKSPPDECKGCSIEENGYHEYACGCTIKCKECMRRLDLKRVEIYGNRRINYDIPGTPMLCVKSMTTYCVTLKDPMTNVKEKHDPTCSERGRLPSVFDQQIDLPDRLTKVMAALTRDFHV